MTHFYFHFKLACKNANQLSKVNTIIGCVKEIKRLNQAGTRVDELQAVEVVSGKPKEVEPAFVDVVGQISLKTLERNDKRRRDQERGNDRRPDNRDNRGPQQNQGQNRPIQNRGPQQQGQQRGPQQNRSQQQNRGQQQRPPQNRDQNRGPQREQRPIQPRQQQAPTQQPSQELPPTNNEN